VQAIISDIHANLEAFKAVLADIERQGVRHIVCLGDFVGYGPNPKECIDLAFDFDIALLGNHELALMEQLKSAGFNLRAKGSLNWTRQCLDIRGEDREANAKRWDFLGSLPESYVDGEVMYVHGTPRDPINEYLRPVDAYNPQKLQGIFSRVQSLCFNGHTHIPGIWTEDNVYLTPHEVNFRYGLVNKKTIVNVGSVGQPRDGDPRACYVLFDGNTVIFRRVPYPLEETIKKMKRIPSLDCSLADRLRDGR